MHQANTLLLFLIVYFNNIAVAAPLSLIPVEAFSKLPAVSDVKLSPDGNYLGMIRTYKGTAYLSTLHIPSQKAFYIVKTDNDKAKFNWFGWANNDTLLLSIRYPAIRWGAESTETRLLKSKANHEGGVKPVFTLRSGNRFQKEHMPQFWDNIVSMLPDDPDHILLSLDLQQPNRPNVYKVNLNGGRRSIQRSRGHVVDWISDQQGQVRIGLEFYETTYSTLLHDLESKKWRRLWKHQTFDKNTVTPLGFGLDPNILYIRAYHQGRKAIFSVDTRTESLERTLVFSDPNYDVDGQLIYSPKTRDIIGIYHYSPNGYIFWDKTYSAFQQALNKALPETSNNIIGFSNDERRYVLYTESSSSPGTYYVGDRDAGTLTPMLATYPELAGKELAKVKKIIYKARDGLEIEAYITAPVNKDPKQPSPTIILPHGGPFARDYGSFDYWAQFFASRGYLVLQPNFRGSSGYGFEFENQAVGNYGQAMQDDLADGLQWLVDRGLTDPDRVCIVGASYGGFAALVGATKTPDLFRCAISFAGISDLKRQRDSYRKYINKKVAQEQFGKDSKALKNISPINHVEKIKTPILLVHGSKDRVVRVEQSKRMAKALKRHNKVYEYIELKDGSHHLDNQSHRITLFRAMESFLEKHLGNAAQ